MDWDAWFMKKMAVSLKETGTYTALFFCLVGVGGIFIVLTSASFLKHSIGAMDDGMDMVEPVSAMVMRKYCTVSQTVLVSSFVFCVYMAG